MNQAEPCGLRVGRVTFRDGSRVTRRGPMWDVWAGRRWGGCSYDYSRAVKMLLNHGYGPAAGATAGRGKVE